MEPLQQAFERFADASLRWASYLTKFFLLGAMTLGAIMTVFIWIGPWDEPSAVLGSTVLLTPMLVFTALILLWTVAFVIALGRFLVCAVLRAGGTLARIAGGS
jgi:hypothetical protein